MLRRISAWAPASEPLSDVITLDFINTALEPGARAGIELTLETAKGLRAALDRAIAAAEFEEAEVRGKGAASPIYMPDVARSVSGELGEFRFAEAAPHDRDGFLLGKLRADVIRFIWFTDHVPTSLAR